MTLHTPTPETTLPLARKQAHDPVGGALIDADGHERPITEHMVRKACQDLEKAMVVPVFKRQH